MSETEVQAEAAFTMELMQSDALRALMQVAPREVVKMAWSLGYVKGVGDGLGKAAAMIGASVK
jgi:hypothetical protein